MKTCEAALFERVSAFKTAFLPGLNGTVSQAREKQKKERPKRPRADAPLRSVGRTVTALIHAAILVGIVSLLVLYITQIPGLMGGQAIASIVAPSLVQVRSPTEGVFAAVEDSPAGMQVKKGQLLGHIRAPRLEAKIRAAQLQLRALHRRKLLLKNPGAELTRPEFESTVGREFHQCLERIVAAQSELELLRKLQKGLRVVSPVTGRLQYGVSGTRAVTTNEPVVHVWPNGGDLLVEVQAPLEQIHELIREGTFEARFSTTGGAVHVRSIPIAGSLRVTAKEDETGKRKELWGFIQCRPLSMPETVAFPGSVGTL